MRVLIAAVIVLGLAGCGHEAKPLDPDRAVLNIRTYVELDTTKSDDDIKEVMHNVCDLADEFSPDGVRDIMRHQGYTAQEAEVFVKNSAAAYCPKYA